MSVENELTCFKAYDVRGKLGEELNEKIAYQIGCATVQSLNGKTVALGFDARETSPILAQAVAKGICDSGANVLHIGLAGTEELYASVCAFKADAGIEITASHNPIEYNGMKIVKEYSQPLSDLEFSEIKRLSEENRFRFAPRTGSIKDITGDARSSYIDSIFDFVDFKNLKTLKIVLNSGNGAAGPTIDAVQAKLEKKLKTNFVYVNHEPDPSFPNGMQIHCLKLTDSRRQMQLSEKRLTLEWLLMVILTVASFLIIKGTLYLENM